MRIVALTAGIAMLISFTIGSPAYAAGTAGGTFRASASPPRSVQPHLKGDVLSRVNSLALAGRSRGLRGKVFMKIGDSNSWFPTFLQGAGCGPMNLSEHKTLRKTIDWYRAGRLDSSVTDLPCAVGNSFTRASAATKPCETSAWPLSDLPSPPSSGYCDTPAPTECVPPETPIECETRLLRPSLALVMIGTNDAGLGGSPDPFESNLRQIVRSLTQRSIVPVLSTIPPRTDSEQRRLLGLEINERIRKVAREARLPLFDLWLALNRSSNLIDGGLLPDGVHLNVLGGWGVFPWAGLSMFLGPTGLRYGSNLRNLLTLELLERLRLRTAL